MNPLQTPSQEGKALAATAARGGVITLAGQGARILVQVLSVVVLARLLSPHDYGLLAMVVAVTGVAEIFRDFGLSTAAIQARTLSRRQRDNLFWINSGIGLVLGLVIFAGAPLLAMLYHQDELVPITRALAAMFVLNGIATQYRANLNRHLQFVRLAVADVAAPAVALVVAAAMALAGFGFWALVAQQLTQYAVMLIIVMIGGRWLPGLPSRREPMDGLIRFGWHIVITQLIGYVSNNADSVVIGVRYGAGPLGSYNRAFQLLMTPFNQIRSPITRVALPVLAKLQDDPVRYGQFVARGQIALGYTLCLGLALVAGASVPVTEVFLGGGEWSAVAPVLTLLAIAAIFQALAFVGYWVYVTRALTRYLVQYSFVSSAIRIVCILVGSNWGIVGVAAGYAIAPALAWPLSLAWLSRWTDIPTKALYLGALRIIALAGVVGIAAWGATLPLVGQPAWMALTAACIAAVVAALVVVALIPRFRLDALGVIDIGRRALDRRL